MKERTVVSNGSNVNVPDAFDLVRPLFGFFVLLNLLVGRLGLLHSGAGGGGCRR